MFKRPTKPMKMGTTRDEARDYEDAHAQGLHDDVPREGCPECERQKNRTK